MLKSNIQRGLYLPLITIEDLGENITVGSNQHHDLYIDKNTHHISYKHLQNGSSIDNKETKFKSIKMINIEDMLELESKTYDEQYEKEIQEILNLVKQSKVKAEERADKKLENAIKDLFKDYDENKDEIKIMI